MKYLILLAVIATIPACGGAPQNVATKDDLTMLEKNTSADLEKKLAQLRQEFSGVQVKITGLELLRKEVQLQLEDADKVLKNLKELAGSLDKEVDTANTNVIKALEIQEQCLKQELEGMHGLIEELKKPH